jgi:hypothetical protein
MEYIVTKTIPREELGAYADYVDYLFLNENGVYNICRNEEDVMKSNQWFKNMPLKTIVVSDDEINVGDKMLVTARNQDMNGKLFTYKSRKDDLVYLEDEKGQEVISTKYIFDGAYKFIRKGTMHDKERVVNGVITPILK